MPNDRIENLQKLLKKLSLAEQQFRLACTVNLAVTNQVQTLDVPVEWAFGKHRVSYEEFGLRADQAEVVAPLLEMTATFVIAAAIRDVLVCRFEDVKRHPDGDVVSAYQISRMLRNAFGHSMISPTWSIDDNCKNRLYSIDRIISLDTTELHAKPVSWRDYGGPLAVFRFGRFVREVLLEDRIDPSRKPPPYPEVECYQQGRLILRRADEQASDSTETKSVKSGESVDLGHGHRILAVPKNDTD